MIKVKGFAVTLTLLSLSLVSCSKDKPAPVAGSRNFAPESLAVAAGQFKNCRFKDQNPVYTFNSPILPNPIVCQEGVATSVQLLTPSPLPNGLQFSMAQLSLIGTAGEKVQKAPYQFYIENNSGYLILKLQITVQ